MDQIKKFHQLWAPSEANPGERSGLGDWGRFLVEEVLFFPIKVYKASVNTSSVASEEGPDKILGAILMAISLVVSVVYFLIKGCVLQVIAMFRMLAGLARGRILYVDKNTINLE
jgi:hypothetical protein